MRARGQRRKASSLGEIFDLQKAEEALHQLKAMNQLQRISCFQFSQPPTPTPPPENSGEGLIPGAQTEVPNSNNSSYGSSQEAHQGRVGQTRLFTVLKKHLRKYSASPATAQQFPYLKDLQENDFYYFSKHIAISQLDIEEKRDVEILELAKYISSYKRVKTLFDLFFEEYFKGND